VEALSNLKHETAKRSLETEKLALEIDRLREQLKETQSRIQLPSLEEVEKYGIAAQEIVQRLALYEHDVKRQAYKAEESVALSTETARELRSVAEELIPRLSRFNDQAEGAMARFQEIEALFNELGRRLSDFARH
jgi:uncharacterized pyridoxal phosphate-containing UPF0001 family protein